jgi:hypothetical protein
MIEQSANAVVMIRPCRFYPNPETASDNAFQREIAPTQAEAVSNAAQGEFDEAVRQLRKAGVKVHVFEDAPEPERPDAVFPNNWFSTHPDGRIAIYPMYSAVRRAERRRDILEQLRLHYHITHVVDYSGSEGEGKYLEGTGSLVLDHLNKVAYASLSQRTHPELVKQFCRDFGYRAVAFRSKTEDGRPIYHTNVMMCLASEFALIGLETISDREERIAVEKVLKASGRVIIDLTSNQVANFAANAIELQGEKGKVLVMSTRGVRALTDEQRSKINQFAKILPLALPTIELAGGSARCMLATIHLPALKK